MQWRGVLDVGQGYVQQLPDVAVGEAVVSEPSDPAYGDHAVGTQQA
jgi:hypothetical protein